MNQRYLVATKEKQGVRANDFMYADEGHIAVFGSVCDGGSVDDKCGCHRSMVTPSNAKATTTVKVVELTEAEQRQALAELLNHYTNGWNMPEAEAVKLAATEMSQNKDIASSFELGAVLEIRGNKVQTR